jgi:hypothetical protein
MHKGQPHTAQLRKAQLRKAQLRKAKPHTAKPHTAKPHTAKQHTAKQHKAQWNLKDPNSRMFIRQFHLLSLRLLLWLCLHQPLLQWLRLYHHPLL